MQIIATMFRLNNVTLVLRDENDSSNLSEIIAILVDTQLFQKYSHKA
jgi:hypothetical protein